MSAITCLKNLRLYIGMSTNIGIDTSATLNGMIDNIIGDYQDELDAQYERGIGSEAIRTAFKIREEAP